MTTVAIICVALLLLLLFRKMIGDIIGFLVVLVIFSKWPKIFKSPDRTVVCAKVLLVTSCIVMVFVYWTRH